MEKLIIMDFTLATVDIYDIGWDVPVDEELIESLGHNVNNCHWMTGEAIELTYHKEPIE